MDISWLIGWLAVASAYLLLIAITPGTARQDRRIAAIADRPRAPAGQASGGPVT